MVCLCVCNLRVRVYKGVLDHSETGVCTARYIASRWQSVPWVKFTGLAIMVVNNPALPVTPLPV